MRRYRLKFLLFGMLCILTPDVYKRQIHVFPYSRREGTKAAEMPGQLSRAVKAERAARLGALAAELSWEYASRFVGTEQEVLFEERDKECLAGHTGTYLRVTVPSADDALLNRFARVRDVYKRQVIA